MKHPPDEGVASQYETEQHVIYGQDVSSTSSSGSPKEGWRFETKGASWHVWTHRTLFDHVDLPLWPDPMDEARIVVSSEMCRDKHYLPPAPFMPPRGLEYCGIHVSATAKQDNRYSVHLARLMMRTWMAEFLDWPNTDSKEEQSGDAFVLPEPRDPMVPQIEQLHSGTPGPDAFIDIGNSSIYYFHQFANQLVDDRPMARLDLARLAIGAHHPLRALIAPDVRVQGTRWLDNQRIQVRLHRTLQGFVSIETQVISVVHPADDIAIVPAPNATASVTWIGPSADTLAFTVSTDDPRPRSVEVAEAFYGQHETATGLAGGSVVERTHEFCSFHPALHISAHAFPHSRHLASGGLCGIGVIQVLPRSYFFDPYQLHDIRGGLGMQYSHYGPVELELPAESMANWGSMLVVEQFPHLDTMDLMVPVHARYRVPGAIPHERTVGFHGEPTGDSHIDVSLLPPLAAVICPLPEVSERNIFGNEVLDSLHVDLALFHELGLVPVSVLAVTPDSDTLLRMPVGKAEYAWVVQILTLVTLFLGTIFVVFSLRGRLGDVCSEKETNHQSINSSTSPTRSKLKM